MPPTLGYGTHELVKIIYRFLTLDVLEVITALAGCAQDHRDVARLAGALRCIRDDLEYRARTPGIRDRIDSAIDAARNTLGDDTFDSAFAEGHQLSLDEIVAYLMRSRGARKRPATGWARALRPPSGASSTRYAEGSLTS